MSENNKDQKPADKVEQSTTEKPKKSNIEIHNEKKREEVKQDLSNAKDEVLEVEKQFLETLKGRASEEAKAYAKIFEDKDDIKSALLILQEHDKNQKPAPNTPSIPQPIGISKVGLAKYMKYVPGSEKISWEIPASVLLDPEKNKKLGEYN